MTESEEPKTPERDSQSSEEEVKSREGETTTGSNKRTFDEATKNEGSKLETLTKIVKSAARRRLVFERTEEDDDMENESSSLENLNRYAKLTARMLEFEKTEKDDALPLSCSICRKPFSDPVVTNCNHYFCNECALKHHETNANCFVCNEPTLGVFNTAVEITQKIAKVRVKARAMVREVLTMVEKAVGISKNADAMKSESKEMVQEVEIMLGMVETHGPDAAADPSSWDSVVNLVETMEVVAAKAREMTEKAAEMVKEANAMTETARAEMAKALMVMKNVKWNV